MTNVKVNIVGNYKKTGLTKADIENAVKAVFDILFSLSSSDLIRGSIKKMDSRPRGNDKERCGNDLLATSKCEVSKGVGNDKNGKSIEKTINIAFVEPKEIQVKNLEYRKKDKPTDVLSFDYGDEGDILLCAGEIESMKEDYESLSEAVQKTLIHGTLHLFGKNHEKEKDRVIMEELEETAFLQLSFPRRRESR